MKIIELGTPLRIGFYQAKAIENCNFQLFSNSIRTEKALKSASGSYRAVLGILFHELIGILSKVSDPIERLKVAKKFIEDEYKKLSEMEEYWWLEPLFSYSETSKLLSTVVAFRPSQNSHAGSNSAFEVEIQSTDFLFVGRVDKLTSSQNLISLHEYKSAITKDINQFVEQHKEQIEFYAGILLERDSSLEVQAELYSGDLIPTKLKLNKDEVLRIIQARRELIRNIIEKSDKFENLQNPTPENCLSCKLKPVCKKFNDSYQTFGQYDGSMLSGKLISVVNRNSNYTSLTFSTVNGMETVVAPTQHPFNKSSVLGSSYVLTNIRQSESHFEILKSTVIYEG